MRRKLVTKSRDTDGDGVAVGVGDDAALDGNANADADADAGGEMAREAADTERWVRWARGRGASAGEMVWELHVLRGRSLAEAGRLLEMPLVEAGVLYAERRAELVARAPRAEADFIALREELRERLLGAYEVACASKDVRYLGLRLKALDQLTRLHGLNVDKGGAGDAAAGDKEAEKPLYPISEETAVKVRDYAMELLGRREDVAEARRALWGEAAG